MIALAARFYGWSWQDIMNMPFRALRRFVDFIPELQAREKLVGATVATMPHMSDKDRKRIHSAWLREAQIDEPKKEGLKGDDLRAFVGAAPKAKDPKKKG